MQIFVSNRQEIQSGKLRLASPHIIISIHDPNKPPAKIPPHPNLRAILAVAFDDCRHAIRDSDAPELSPITPAQAIQIRDFVRFHQPHVAAIVVHCEQGFSRSPAIAAALAEALGLDHTPFLKNYAANYYVYDTVLEAFELHSNPPTN